MAYILHHRIKLTYFFRNHLFKISHILYKIGTSVLLVKILWTVIIIKQKNESLYRKRSKVPQKALYEWMLYDRNLPPFDQKYLKSTLDKWKK